MPFFIPCGNFLKRPLLTRLSIAKPAFDLLAERMAEAGSIASGSGPSSACTPIAVLIERHGRFETAAVCAAAENMACIFLIQNFGLREACERISPLVGVRAKAHLDLALNYVYRKADSLASARDVDTPACLESVCASEPGLVQTTLSTPSRLLSRSLDRGCRAVFGEEYLVSGVRYCSGLLKLFVSFVNGFSTDPFSNLLNKIADKAEASDYSFLSSLCGLLFEAYIVSLCVASVILAFLSVYTTIVAQETQGIHFQALDLPDVSVYRLGEDGIYEVSKIEEVEDLGLDECLEAEADATGQCGKEVSAGVEAGISAPATVVDAPEEGVADPTVGFLKEMSAQETVLFRFEAALRAIEEVIKTEQLVTQEVVLGEKSRSEEDRESGSLSEAEDPASCDQDDKSEVDTPVTEDFNEESIQIVTEIASTMSKPFFCQKSSQHLPNKGNVIVLSSSTNQQDGLLANSAKSSSFETDFFSYSPSSTPSKTGKFVTRLPFEPIPPKGELRIKFRPFKLKPTLTADAPAFVPKPRIASGQWEATVPSPRPSFWTPARPVHVSISAPQKKRRCNRGKKAPGKQFENRFAILNLNQY